MGPRKCIIDFSVIHGVKHKGADKSEPLCKIADNWTG